MATPFPSVELHPQKDQIIRDILAGKSVRAIAATLTPPLHFMSLSRYRQRIVKPSLSASAAIAKVLGETKAMSADERATKTIEVATRALQGDVFRERIVQHHATIDKALSSTEDPRAVASLISADLRGVELNARLAGRLDGNAAALTVNIVVPMSDQPAIETFDGEVIDIKAIEK